MMSKLIFVSALLPAHLVVKLPEDSEKKTELLTKLLEEYFQNKSKENSYKEFNDAKGKTTT